MDMQVPLLQIYSQTQKGQEPWYFFFLIYLLQKARKIEKKRIRDKTWDQYKTK